jgi:hypothetical protein
MLLLSSLSAHRPTAHSFRRVSHFALPCHHTTCTTFLCYCCCYLCCLALLLLLRPYCCALLLLLLACMACRCYCGYREPRRSSRLVHAPSNLVVPRPPQAGAHHQPCSTPLPDAHHWRHLSVPCSRQVRLVLLSLEHCPASSFPSHRDIRTPPHYW